MKVNIRKSSLKHRRKTSFLRRMRTKDGRAIINRQRNRACGKPKRRGKRS